MYSYLLRKRDVKIGHSANDMNNIMIENLESVLCADYGGERRFTDSGQPYVVVPTENTHVSFSLAKRRSGDGLFNVIRAEFPLCKYITIPFRYRVSIIDKYGSLVCVSDTLSQFIDRAKAFSESLHDTMMDQRVSQEIERELHPRYAVLERILRDEEVNIQGEFKRMLHVIPCAPLGSDHDSEDKVYRFSAALSERELAGVIRLVSGMRAGMSSEVTEDQGEDVCAIPGIW